MGHTGPFGTRVSALQALIIAFERTSHSSSPISELLSSSSILFSSFLPSSLLRSSISPQLPIMQQFLPPQTPTFQCLYLTSELIEPSEGADALLFEACQLAEASDVEDFQSVLPNDFAKVEKNRVFLDKNLFSDDNSDQDSDWENFLQNTNSFAKDSCLKSNDEEDHMDIDNYQPTIRQCRSIWVPAAISSTIHAKQKLVQILRGDICIPRQRWGLDKILKTLVIHQKDPQLRTSYWQFRTFAYQTMMKETNKEIEYWLGVLTQKDFNIMIKLRLQKELEKWYGQEIQTFYKTPSFGLATNSKSCSKKVDQRFLTNIIKEAQEKALLLGSMIMSVGPSSWQILSASNANYSQLVSMKIVAILVIFCRSAHWNNSNYVPLLIALYMYSARARVDAITLLNHLGLSVSYDILQKKLYNLTKSTTMWIKRQGSNCKLVGSWDNFEFWKNVHGKRTGNTVKFQSITIALWIQQGWRIPNTGLQQWMWNPKREYLDIFLVMSSIFGHAGTEIRKKCQQMHRFNAFRTGFPQENFSHQPRMPIINIIDCKRKKSIKPFLFALSMFNESSIAGNLAVFEDPNIIQIGLDKTNAWWADSVTLC